MIDDDLRNLSDVELERYKKMLDIVKTQQDIVKMQAEMQRSHELNMSTLEQMRIENEKYRAETLKIMKETKYYPGLTIFGATAAVIGGIVAGLITRYLNSGGPTP